MSDLPPSTDSTAQLAFEAAARRYFAKICRRYAPVAIGMVVLLLVLVLVPTTEPHDSDLASDDDRALGTDARSGGDLGTGGDDTTDPFVGGVDDPGTGAGGGDTSGPGGATGGGSNRGGRGTTPAKNPAANASGKSKTGVTCGNGVRQFSWTVHSPFCVPAFTGNNGGATGQGVTKDTITLSYRVPSTAQASAINAAAGDANVDYDAMIVDFNSYISFFNSQFELYGRQVVLKPFNSQGDYIDEHQGRNLAGAQADAVTARTMGAFGDVSFSLTASQAYGEALADQKVISFSSVAQPQTWYEKYAPYQFQTGTSGTTGIDVAVEVLCRRVNGMKAIFAGDAALQALPQRTFGIIYPEIPNYAALANRAVTSAKAKCGMDFKEKAGYRVDVAQFPTQATAIMARFASQQISTVLCACDPIFPIFLTNAASGQSYHPEWLSTTAGDPAARLLSQDQWNHAFGAGKQYPDPKSTEPYKAFKLGSPDKEPAQADPPYYPIPYYQLLQVFLGIQAAGPNLTARTFEQAHFGLPGNTGPDPIGGQWTFGKKVYTPSSSYNFVWWDPTYTSKFDGKEGGYRDCNGGKEYSIFKPEELGGPNQQLNCFGK